MRKASLIMMLALAMVLAAGCGGSGSEQAQAPSAELAQAPATEQTPAPATETAPAQQPAAAAAPAAQSPQPSAQPQRTAPAASAPSAAVAPAPAAAAAPPPPPAPKIAVVAGGSELAVRLVQALNSSKNKTGETFEATLDEPLEADGTVVAPRGSIVVGKLTNVEGSGRVQGRARMSLTLSEIRIGETAYSLATNTLSFEAESSTKKDAAKIGIGAGVGAAIGAIAGGGKGAAIGAAVGGGAGTATVLATKGKEVGFDPEQKLSFTLRDDLKITLPPE